MDERTQKWRKKKEVGGGLLGPQPIISNYFQPLESAEDQFFVEWLSQASEKINFDEDTEDQLAT